MQNNWSTEENRQVSKFHKFVSLRHLSRVAVHSTSLSSDKSRSKYETQRDNSKSLLAKLLQVCVVTEAQSLLKKLVPVSHFNGRVKQPLPPDVGR